MFAILYSRFQRRYKVLKRVIHIKHCGVCWYGADVKLAAFVRWAHASRLLRMSGRKSSVEPNAVGLGFGYQHLIRVYLI